MSKPRTLVLFNYDWDEIANRKLAAQWPHTHSGFDLFTFPSNARLAWFDMNRFTTLSALKAKVIGAKAVTSNHEQFGALCAALLAERMGWPGTPVKAILACQHKLYARQILQKVAPEANLPFQRLEAEYGAEIPEGLPYPAYVKPIKAAFSVLARQVNDNAELHKHTRFAPWELWVIRHLVEPFEKIMKERLPHAPTAHSLMLEEPRRGKQFNLDGYVFNAQFHAIGVVDAIMYPNTDAFMRFDYPSRLNPHAQAKALDVAKRFLTEVGFTHGMFNMEFFYDEQTDTVTVIEFNPRMASQFSDLYERVNGINLHEMAFAMAHGIDPASLTKLAPTAGAASSFVYRSFDPTREIAMPAAGQVQTFNQTYPDGLLFQFPKLAGQIERDFKWLNSYRYGIMHLGGKDQADLKARCEHASSLLGWPAPYQESSHEFSESHQPYPAWLATEAS